MLIRNNKNRSLNGFGVSCRRVLTAVIKMSGTGRCSDLPRAEIYNRSLFEPIVNVLSRPLYFPWDFFSRFFCVSTAIFFASPSNAAEWTTESSVSFGVGYYDNVALTTGPHESVSSISLTPRVKFGRITETSAVNIGLLVNAKDYSNSAVKDENEQILSLRSFLRTTERTRLEVDGEIRRENLFETLLVDPGIGDLRDTDIGLIDTKIKRTLKTVTPSWAHSLSERSSLRLAVRFTDVSFSDTSSPNVVEYDEHSATARYSYRATNTSNVSASIYTSRYRPKDTNDKSETNQLSIGASRTFSEMTRGRFSVGTSKTTETTTAGKIESSGSVFEAGIVQNSELSTLEGVFSRDVHPSGAGKLVESDQIRVYFDRRITRKLSFGAKVKLFRDNVIEGSDPDIDRRYFEVKPELRWHWLPQWFFRTSYRYRRQKYDAEAETAKSNALFLGAAYAWPKISASR